VAFDIRRSAGTDFLADAHRLPLDSGSFDVAISTQVMEHLHSPWIAAAEIARVLRPGGWFIGSVAFLKPYHDSYFHMTHKGVMHLLRSVGLEVDRVMAAQSITYTLYGGMLPVGSRPLRRTLLGAVDRVLFGSRALAWQLTRRVGADEPTDRFHAGVPLSFRQFDRLRNAPAVVFRARKG
jgi:SAM-dependent methyltransferase